MRALIYARNPSVRCRVGGVLLTKPLLFRSLSGSEGNFEVSFSALPRGLDTALFLSSLGNAGIVLLESSQNDTDVYMFSRPRAGLATV